MRKTVAEYEAEGWYMVHDDTPPEGGVVDYTEEELEYHKILVEKALEKYKHHFE